MKIFRCTAVLLAVILFLAFVVGEPSLSAQTASRSILVGVTSPSHDDVARIIRNISGHPDGSFHPQATATTTEISAVFARFLELLEEHLREIYFDLQEPDGMLYDEETSGWDSEAWDSEAEYVAAVIHVFTHDDVLYDNPSAGQTALFTLELSLWRIVLIGAGVVILVALAVAGLYTRMKAPSSGARAPQYYAADSSITKNQSISMTCTNCGAGFGETSKFCVKCGNPRG